MSFKVIHFVAGGGKTTEAIKYLSSHPNGLYLAFTNSVVEEVKNRGFCSKTIDGFFHSYILPKLCSKIKIISKYSDIVYADDKYLKNHPYLSKLKIDNNGVIYDGNIKTPFTLKTTNYNLHNYKSIKHKYAVAYAFSCNHTYITEGIREGLCYYLINNYMNCIETFIKQRFSYVLLDEAQDISGYKEKFVQKLSTSCVDLILYGDPNQKIFIGSEWFGNLEPDEINFNSHRCPEINCQFIRKNIGIEIYGNKDPGGVSKINMDQVQTLNDGIKVLIYDRTYPAIKDILSNWLGPKFTIKSAKGMTINQDVVIVGNSLSKNQYYTAITRTKKCVFTTINSING